MEIELGEMERNSSACSNAQRESGQGCLLYRRMWKATAASAGFVEGRSVKNAQWHQATVVFVIDAVSSRRTGESFGKGRVECDNLAAHSGNPEKKGQALRAEIAE